MRKIVFILLLYFSFINQVFSENVIDGDTLKINNIIYRIYGIDAPEKNQTCSTRNYNWACGLVATNELIKLVAGEEIICKKISKDRYNRIIAKCFVNRIDIGKTMVNSGWALAYRQYSLDYINQEERAKSMKLGIWSSKFIAPWKWRNLSRESKKIRE